jgi:xanthine dehydrogenase iron-sulfur cluster and FAD-binding subunit A
MLTIEMNRRLHRSVLVQGNSRKLKDAVAAFTLLRYLLVSDNIRTTDSGCDAEDDSSPLTVGSWMSMYKLNQIQ